MLDAVLPALERAQFAHVAPCARARYAVVWRVAEEGSRAGGLAEEGKAALPRSRLARRRASVVEAELTVTTVSEIPCNVRREGG